MSLLPHARARRHLWWLTAVFLLAMLAPGISAALAHARGDFSAWQDICRSPATRGQATEPTPVDKALEVLAEGHCPACHMSWTDLAAPPAPVVAAVRTELGFAAPERFWSAPRTAHAWRPASARAPPR